MTAAGCTFDASAVDRRAAAHVRARPDGPVSDVPGGERHPQPDDVDLGQLPAPGRPPPGRAQPRARRHRHLVRPRHLHRDREALDRFYEEDENGIIITPIPDPYPGVTYPKHERLGSKIALTAWTANSDTGGAPSTSPRARRSTRRRSRRSATRSAAMAPSASRSARWCPAATRFAAGVAGLDTRSRPAGVGSPSVIKRARIEFPSPRRIESVVDATRPAPWRESRGSRNPALEGPEPRAP